MRIGIVTQPLEMNYGGILQNWALQQVLKRLGHDPVTIDAYQRFSTPHYVYNWVRGKLMRMMGKKSNMPLRYHGAMRSKQTGEFIEKHIVKTRVMWDYKPEVVKKYKLEGLVVGSDQVWRIWYSRNHLEDMYLRFAAGQPLKKRVVYAASLGVDEWEYPADEKLPWTPYEPEAETDDFDDPRLGLHMVFLGTPYQDFWKIEDGCLKLRCLARPMARPLHGFNVKEPDMRQDAR